MTPVLRPYQVSMARQALRLIEQDVAGILIELATGGGKTETGMAIIKTLTDLGLNVGWFAHRRELIKQASTRATRFEIEHGLIMPGHRHGSSPLHIASIDTARARLDDLADWLDSLDVAFFDECFPAGTPVDGRPIEEIKVGDYVRSFNHTTNVIERRPVTHRFRRAAPALLTIILVDGRRITCTREHPIFNGESYVPACSLSPGGVVAVANVGSENGDPSRPSADQGCGDDVRMVFDPDGMPRKGRLGASASRAGLLLDRVPGCLDVGEQLNHDGGHEPAPCFGADGGAQSDDVGSGQSQDVGDASGNPTPPIRQRREREWPDQAAGSSRRASASVGNGIRSSDASEARHVAHPLQDRHRNAGGEACDRGGRRQPQFACSTGAGRQERSILDLVRVDRVEVHKPGDFAGSAGLCPDGHVYNLEVDGNNNYFVDDVLVHNCHHVMADGWQAVAEAARNAVRIGLSATMFRKDGKGLGANGLFTHIIRGPAIRDLVAQGYLAPPEVYAPPAKIDLAGVQKRGGDWVQGQLARAVDTPELALLGARYYARYSAGEPAVVFCAGVDHARNVAAAFTRAGWAGAAIDGEMSMAERDAAISGLASGRLQVLTSCDLISEGFDCPSIAAAILLRPTQSTGLYLQQVGRALRTHPGKRSGLIIDLVGNVERHGMPDVPRPWTLEGGISGLERSVPATRRCTHCFRVQDWADRCIGCGKAFPLRAPPARPMSDLRNVPGFRGLGAVEIAAMKPTALIDLARSEDELRIIARIKGYDPSWVEIVARKKGFAPDRPASRFAGRGGRW